MNDSFSLLLNLFRICGSFAISSINRFCCSSRWDPKWDALWWLWSIWWTQIIPNPRSLCYLIAVHLTKHHSETQGEKPEKGPKPRNSFRQGAGDLGLFFHFGKGGYKTLLKHFLKMVMEMRNDADGCLTTNVWIWRVTVLDYRWVKNWIVISSFYVVLVSFACGHDSLSAICYGSMYDSRPYISEFWTDFLFQLMKNSGSTPSMFLKSPHVGTNEVIEEAPEIPGSRGVWVMFLLTVLIQEWLGEHFSQRKPCNLV